MSKLTKIVMPLAVVGMAATAFMATPAKAEWQPKGPISVIIGFAAGGGTDTQARLIAAELKKRKGWNVIPSNVTGKGGVVMARKLKGLPNDGLTIGMAVTEVFGYNMLASKKAGYKTDDFTYIATTTSSQMGIVANTSKGWKTFADVIAAAKKGKVFKFAGMSAKHADINFLIEQKYGVKFNTVVLRGGRKVMNAIIAGDVDLGYGAGIQSKAVRSGKMVNLASGLSQRLKISPNAPTLVEMGIPYDIGAKFIFVAPAGIPGEARKALADAIGDIINDPSTKASQYVSKGYGGPDVITGKKLDAFIQNEIKIATVLMKLMK
ncbi:MAG: tripartite tricarboxylate transporter substrate binding protein [Rhodospirillaceae bacterium]|jgi:tripartite-type tricarboxylate transporter receptor subunit TctC|nr:tripartite tricarboxylate transporter substrate binding protein [Rhodospirillaceae bacterium]MBT4937543.1 tripartite tricarboxylate transporter substrate binding protein [Rhodospirillaceae bacterium]